MFGTRNLHANMRGVSRYTKESWKWGLLITGFLFTLVGLFGLYYEGSTYIYADWLGGFTGLGIIMVFVYAWLAYPQ